MVFVAPTISDADEVEGSSNVAEDIIEVDDVMASNKVKRKFKIRHQTQGMYISKEKPVATYLKDLRFLASAAR